MAEDISQLMDGELDPDQVAGACSRLREPKAAEAWNCYHVIGEALRGSAGHPLSTDFSRRLSERLAAEPTVLAPRRRAASSARMAWAVAASVAAVALVGWMALPMFETRIPVAALNPVATPAGDVQAGGMPVRRANLGEYLLVHQEYSPATMLQGVQPYIRAVSTDDTANR